MKHSTIWDNKIVRWSLIGLFWLAVWQTVSLFTPKLLFASPLRTWESLAGMAGRADFWLSIAGSILKAYGGFAAAFVLGVLFAALCLRVSFLQMLFMPVIHVMKSIPVACFVIVALIWISSRNISVLVSFFVVFPVTFISVQTGAEALDPQLTEMARVFRIPWARRVRGLYLPQILPSVVSGCTISIGMCWKAAIAGEVIGLPKYSIGERLYLSKLYLETGELFAWMLVILVCSMALEKALIALLYCGARRVEGYAHD